uniref:Uncharacterized protein n=1 Tax=Euplotes crassus TaxID=5936 RepID=A0A7S3NYA4_EUPCR|mmetsp:Transcript_34407/g.34020  ORF Transcript_34407/g.34020 Transcript_34407/m.34020 type:complete len:153 (+) Transcript_34407:667-1125(+)
MKTKKKNLSKRKDLSFLKKIRNAQKLLAKKQYAGIWSNRRPMCRSTETSPVHSGRFCLGDVSRLEFIYRLSNLSKKRIVLQNRDDQQKQKMIMDLKKLQKDLFRKISSNGLNMHKKEKYLRRQKFTKRMFGGVKSDDELRISGFEQRRGVQE